MLYGMWTYRNEICLKIPESSSGSCSCVYLASCPKLPCDGFLGIQAACKLSFVR